jgi:hypothetical protein
VVDDATTAVAPAEAMHGGKGLLRGLSDVSGVRWIKADVADAAILHTGLAKVSADRGRPATGTSSRA